MTTQQKIEFYLSKGFACEIKFEDGDIIKLLYSDTHLNFIGYCIFDGQAILCDKWDDEDIEDWKKIKSITPIPPKPYEFKVGERVMILDGSEKGAIGLLDEVDAIDVLVKLRDKEFFSTSINNIAPALPEDEECEVVEVKSLDAFEFNAKGTVTFTKPDGKKLKIKVVKPNPRQRR